MIGQEDILATIRMFREENLDIRTATLGINLVGCSTANIDIVCEKIRQKIKHLAGSLLPACELISNRYGIPVTNKRLAVSPIGSIISSNNKEAFLKIARSLDGVAAEIGVDLVGGFSALIQKGITKTESSLIQSLPIVLSDTQRVCASVNVASTKSGLNMDALLLMGEVIKEASKLSADKDGFACAKLCVFANMPEDNPFMAGACHGFGEPEAVINIGVSGPGVIKRAIVRLKERSPEYDLQELASVIKQTSFRVTRVGELVGRALAKKLGVKFGVVDLSLAPTTAVGDSVGEIIESMGIGEVGAPGSTAALALLNDAVKKGGLFASSSVGGMSGSFIAVAEDSSLADAVRKGSLSLEKLEAMTSVCSVGLDMICIPGDTDVSTIVAIMADEMAIGVMNNKTTSTRIIPVPNRKIGDEVIWGGLFGASPIMRVRASGVSSKFVSLGGRIPAPVHSFTN